MFILQLMLLWSVHGLWAAPQYEFTQDWFTRRIPSWQKNLSTLKDKPNLRYLEIGVFEGRSALWLLENILTGKGSQAVLVDPYPFEGDKEIKERALRNFEKFGHKEKWKLVVETSEKALRVLPLKSFDLIYVDGSHMARDVLLDLTQAWSLLKVGGLLIVDDMHNFADYPPELRIREAAEDFIKAYRPEVEVVEISGATILRKEATACQRCLRLTKTIFYNWTAKNLNFENFNQPLPVEAVAAVEWWVKNRGPLETRIDWVAHSRAKGMKVLKEKIEDFENYVNRQRVSGI